MYAFFLVIRFFFIILRKNIFWYIPRLRLIYWCICVFNLQLPTPDKLKTVADKVKDFFGDVKESFGEITSLVTATDNDESEEDSKEKTKWVLCLFAIFKCDCQREFSSSFFPHLYFLQFLDATYLIEVSLILCTLMNIIQLHRR